MTKIKKTISLALAACMSAMIAVPSMAAETENANVTIVTEINGQGVITESVGGEIRTSTYTTDNVINSILGATDTPAETAQPTEAPGESPAPSVLPESDELINKAEILPDLDSPIYNSYLFKLIKAYIDHYLETYNNTPEPTSSPVPAASPAV